MRRDVALQEEKGELPKTLFTVLSCGCYAHNFLIRRVFWPRLMISGHVLGFENRSIVDIVKKRKFIEVLFITFCSYLNMQLVVWVFI